MRFYVQVGVLLLTRVRFVSTGNCMVGNVLDTSRSCIIIVSFVLSVVILVTLNCVCASTLASGVNAINIADPVGLDMTLYCKDVLHVYVKQVRFLSHHPCIISILHVK